MHSKTIALMLINSLLACLPHYTSGQTYFYPAFNAAKSEDAVKFAHEFSQVIAMPIMVEAVMRVRATKGNNKVFTINLIHGPIPLIT